MNVFSFIYSTLPKHPKNITIFRNLKQISETLSQRKTLKPSNSIQDSESHHTKRRFQVSKNKVLTYSIW